jgi:hypothetical protein
MADSQGSAMADAGLTPSRIPVRRRRSSLRVVVPLLLFLIIALAVATRALQILNSFNRVTRDLTAFTSLETNLGAPGDNAGAIIAEIRMLRTDIGWLPSLGPLFFWLPRYGQDLASAPALVAMLDDVTDAADATLSIYARITAPPPAESVSPGQAIINAVQDNQAAIEQARQAIAKAQLERAKINSAALSPTLKRQLARLDQLMPAWRAGLELAEFAPVLLGKTSPRAYLVLAQNPDELRPTGGYISSLGLIRVANGNFSSVELRDSYAVDDLSLTHPVPPPALVKYMYAGQWLVRDSNWYPDFPTTAVLAMSMYKFDRRIQTDGVIAVDMRLIPDLLAAVGPIRVESTGEIVTPGTVIAQMQTHWAPPPDKPLTNDQWEHRKDFVSEVMIEMVDRIKKGEFERGALVRALWKGLTAKNLMVYFNEPPIENALAQAGWSGSVFSPLATSLAVIDSNVGFNKVNANITQAITFTINVGTERDHVRAEISYWNDSPTENAPCDQKPRYGPDYGSLTRGCYYDLVRVIVPKETRFISSRNVQDAGMGEEFAGVASLQGFFMLKPKSATTVEFEFDMPTAIHGDYGLILQKQAGTPAFPLLVEVNLPPDNEARGSNLQAVESLPNRMTFNLLLDQDVSLLIDIARPIPGWIYGTGLVGAGAMLVGLFLLLWRK